MTSFRRGRQIPRDGAATDGVYRILRDNDRHLHGQEVGPMSVGASRKEQRHYILLGVGKHHVENEVGWAWEWVQGNCGESEDVGGDGEFPPEAQDHRRTGLLWVLGSDPFLLG